MTFPKLSQWSWGKNSFFLIANAISSKFPAQNMTVISPKFLTKLFQENHLKKLTLSIKTNGSPPSMITSLVYYILKLGTQ